MDDRERRKLTRELKEIRRKLYVERDHTTARQLHRRYHDLRRQLAEP